MSKITVIIEKDKNGFGAFTASTKSTILGEGKKVEEAKADLMNSFNEVLETYTQIGQEIPEELKDPEFEYTYDISALFDAFRFLNVSRFAESIGLSPSLMRHYKRGDTYISTTQAKRIESGLHRVARELLMVNL